MAEKLVVYIPFEQEVRLAQQWPDALVDETETSRYLQGLMDRLTVHMDLPPEMKITVHYADDDTVNAFATLGGHVIIHRGLLEEMGSENALAMVMAHEAAHIKRRHPIISMGRGVVIGMALASLSGFAGEDLFANFLGHASMMTLMSFSREQEREADRLGLAAVASEYGHVAGATVVYQRFLEQSETLDKLTPEFMSTHPLSTQRIDQVTADANTNGWQTTGPITALPEQLRFEKD